MKFFVAQNPLYYLFYLLVFKPRYHFGILRDSVLFAQYIVLDHIEEIARVSNVLCGIEIECRRRVLAVNGLSPERANSFPQNFEMQHFRYGDAFKRGGVLRIPAFVEIEKVVKILQNRVELARRRSVRGGNNRQTVSVRANTFGRRKFFVQSQRFRHIVII